MSAYRVCIIGGNGFIGTYAAEHLAKLGMEITIPTRHYARHKYNLSILPGVTVINSHVHEQAVLTQLCDSHDVVINMVGMLHGSRSHFEAAHVELTSKIIEACRRTKPRLIHISALGASTSGASDYQQTKAAAEQYVMSSDLDWTIFRPSVVFGRGDSFLTLFAQLSRLLPVIPLVGATTRIQPIWVGDVVRAIEVALMNHSLVRKVIDLAGPKVYTLQQLLKYVGYLTGYPRPILPIPLSIGMLQARLMELLPGTPLLSCDNVRTLKTDNVSCDGFPSALLGFAPSLLESVAPGYLSHDTISTRLALYRQEAQR